MHRKTDRKPVVAVVTDAIYPYHKGGKEVLHDHLSRGLVDRGFDVHVYTMHWWDGPPMRVEHGVHFHALCARHDLYVDARRSVRQAIRFSIACLRLATKRFDVIQADQIPFLPLLPLRLVAALRRVPLVVTWHEVWGPTYWREYLGAVGPLASAAERLSMRTPDHIVVVSPGPARRLVENGVPAAKVTVVPNGVDLAKILAVAPASASFDVVFAGRLLAHKGVDSLLRAIALLRARGRNTTCAVIGDGPERVRLEALCQELDLTREVAFLGTLEDVADVYAMMKSARTFALPSTREGYGLVVAEALACGTPVVTTDYPDNNAQHLVRDGIDGAVCAPDPVSIADALERVLRLDRAGIGAVSCTWEDAAASLAGVLDRVLQRAARRAPGGDVALVGR